LAKRDIGSRSVNILRTLYDRSNPITTFTVKSRQNELAQELGITRQALNVHLRKLRDEGCIRTGRGFIDITDNGLKLLGFSSTPAFVFIKIEPHMRSEAYGALLKFPIQRAFRVAGDMDIVIVVDRDKIDKVLAKVSQIPGVEDTKSYLAIEPLR
jgi:DNA-binding Lrp family transcriptional regulator